MQAALVARNSAACSMAEDNQLHTVALKPSDGGTRWKVARAAGAGCDERAEDALAAAHRARNRDEVGMSYWHWKDKASSCPDGDRRDG